MAIYHFSGTIISRSQGRSAVACAAYRSASRLQDERYDKIHDYSKKKDVAHTEILLPTSATASWMSDREKLWNFVEACEKRKDAQLAREFNFALPRELTLAQNIALARDFVQQEFVSKGMVADLCIHNDKNPAGELQPHAHVMLTLREVTSEGFGQKVREWNAKENLLLWREAWAEVANQHLFLQGHDLKIDHRTLEAQQIDLEPQHKIGAAVAKERLARWADHQRIALANGEKLFVEPELALTAITRQQSTFTHHDIARFVNRHTVDAAQFQAVYDKVLGCESLVRLGVDEQQRERFTMQAMLAVETEMLGHAEQLLARPAHQVEASYVEQALTSRTLSSEQQLAFNHLVSDGDLKNVIGYAGSGKSYLLGAAREAWEAQGYQVHGVTLSGIAAENLEAGSGITSRTMASRTYYWDKGEQLLTDKDILVVDEAGMMGSRQLHRLLAEAAKHQAKIVLVGDPYQLQAIEAGGAFRAVSEHSPTVSLTEIRRQQVAWQREATVELATGKTEAAIERYAKQAHVHAFETQAMAKYGLVELWNDARLAQPDKTQIILTYTREDVRSLNEMARQLRRKENELGVDHTLMTERGERVFAEHDRVYFLKNDRDLGVKNGTLGTIERIQNNLLVVRLDPSDPQAKVRMITFSTERYNHLDHGYAATIHKTQGVTVDRAYLLASKYMDGHATYVGLSRHRLSADVFYSQEAFANERALVHALSRERSKDVTLDYQATITDVSATSIEQITTFAQRRGFEATAQSSEIQLPHVRSVAEPQSTLQSPSLQTQHQGANTSQTQTKRYDQLLQEAARNYANWEQGKVKPSSLSVSPAPSPTSPLPSRADLSAFKKQFEAEHPERAKALQTAIQPRHERLALEAEKQINLLEKATQQSAMPRTAREQLEKYAFGIAKQTDVMGYLKQRNPDLSEKIQRLAKTREKQLELDRGRSR